MTKMKGNKLTYLNSESFPVSQTFFSKKNIFVKESKVTLSWCKMKKSSMSLGNFCCFFVGRQLLPKNLKKTNKNCEAT